MAKLYLLLIGLSFITLFPACGQPSAPTVEAVVRSMYDEFYDEANKRGIRLEKDVDIRLVDKLSHTSSESGLTALAICDFEKNNIEVRKYGWKNYSYNEQRAILFHELGHCALKRGHDNIQKEIRLVDKNGSVMLNLLAPLSLMNGVFSDESFSIFNSYWEKYLDELFSHSTIQLPDYIKINPIEFSFSINSEEVSLSWTFPLNVSTYMVYRQEQGHDGEFLGLSKSTKYVDNVSPGIYRYYIIPVIFTFYSPDLASNWITVE